MKQRRAYGLAASLGVALAVIPAGVAHADPLTAFTFCQGLGAKRMECVAEPSGGTAPYTIVWGGPATGQPSSQDVAFNCDTGFPNARTVVPVTVVDATGATFSASPSAICLAGAPR